jgi:hypothetical protein
MRIELSDQQLEQLADLVVQRLRAPSMIAPTEVVDVQGLAQRLGMSPDFVRDNREALGGIKVGARLLFQWPQALENARRASGRSQEPPAPVPAGPQPSRTQPSRPRVPAGVPVRLLPIAPPSPEAA